MDDFDKTQRILKRLLALTVFVSCANGCRQTSLDDGLSASHNLSSENTDLNLATGPTAGGVWLAPNVGSKDFLKLFSQPERWAEARKKVKFVQFYGANVSTPTVQRAGDNNIINFKKVGAFELLKKWGIHAALEVGVIKAEGAPAACSHKTGLPGAMQMMRHMRDAGLAPSFVSLDEPLWAGIRRDRPKNCGLDGSRVLLEVGGWISEIKKEFPDVQIGLIEPYPAVSAQQIIDFVKAATNRYGIKFSHVRLDINDEALPAVRRWPTDILKIKSEVERLGIVFGVIYDPVIAGSNKEGYSRILANVRRFKPVLGAPVQRVYQSWGMMSSTDSRQLLPDNLSDAVGQFSLTRALIDSEMIHLK